MTQYTCGQRAKLFYFGFKTQNHCHSLSVTGWVRYNNWSPVLLVHVPANTAWQQTILQTSSTADLHCSFEQFSALSVWWHGPKWLKGPQRGPTWDVQSVSLLHTAASTAEAFVAQPQTPHHNIGLHEIFILDNYSTLDWLLAVAAYIQLFVDNFSSRPTNQEPTTTLTLRNDNSMYPVNNQCPTGDLEGPWKPTVCWSKFNHDSSVSDVFVPFWKMEN